MFPCRLQHSGLLNLLVFAHLIGESGKSIPSLALGYLTLNYNFLPTNHFIHSFTYNSIRYLLHIDRRLYSSHPFAL